MANALAPEARHALRAMHKDTEEMSMVQRKEVETLQLNQKIDGAMRDEGRMCSRKSGRVRGHAEGSQRQNRRLQQVRRKVQIRCRTHKEEQQRQT